MMDATSMQVEYNRRYRRRLREARDGYERLLHRVLRVERERDRLREVARQRLELVRTQAEVIKARIAELDRLREAAAAEAMIESGEPAAQADPAVPLPAGKREPQTVYDGIRRVPVPPGWGGRIESGPPRRRGIPADPYGDCGPLSADD